MLKVPYAKPNKQDGFEFQNLIHADQAVKHHDYFCPNCSGVVRLRGGTAKVRKHFYHLSGDSSGCGAAESLLHLLAKQVFLNEPYVWLPHNAQYIFFHTQKAWNDYRHQLVDKKVDAFDRSLTNEKHFVSSNSKEEGFGIKHQLGSLKKYGLVSVANVEQEVYLGTVRPDIVADINGERCLIEAANTHFVDDAKLEKLKQIGINTIEIDLKKLMGHRSFIDYEVVKSALMKSNDYVRWIYRADAKPLQQSLISRIDSFIDDYNLKLQSDWKKHEEILKRKQQIKQQRQDELEKQYRKKLAPKLDAIEKMKLEFADQDEQIDLLYSIFDQYKIPRLSGDRLDVIKALELRNKRIHYLSNNFGEDSILSDVPLLNVRLASEWINAADQVTLKEPPKFTAHYENAVLREATRVRNQRLNERTKKQQEGIASKAKFQYCPSCNQKLEFRSGGLCFCMTCMKTIDNKYS